VSVHLLMELACDQMCCYLLDWASFALQLSMLGESALGQRMEDLRSSGDAFLAPRR